MRRPDCCGLRPAAGLGLAGPGRRPSMLSQHTAFADCLLLLAWGRPGRPHGTPCNAAKKVCKQKVNAHIISGKQTAEQAIA